LLVLALLLAGLDPALALATVLAGAAVRRARARAFALARVDAATLDLGFLGLVVGMTDARRHGQQESRYGHRDRFSTDGHLHCSFVELVVSPCVSSTRDSPRRECDDGRECSVAPHG